MFSFEIHGNVGNMRSFRVWSEDWSPILVPQESKQPFFKPKERIQRSVLAGRVDPILPISCPPQRA